MDLAAAAAAGGALLLSQRPTSQDCCGPAGAAGGRGQERHRATRTKRPRYHRKRADASVRCTGPGDAASQSMRHVQGYCFD